MWCYEVLLSNLNFTDTNFPLNMRPSDIATLKHTYELVQARYYVLVNLMLMLMVILINKQNVVILIRNLNFMKRESAKIWTKNQIFLKNQKLQNTYYSRKNRSRCKIFEIIHLYGEISGRLHMSIFSDTTCFFL